MTSPPSRGGLASQSSLRLVDQLQELKSCMPLRDDQVELAGSLIRRATLQELEQAGLAAPPLPAVPPNLDKLPLKQRLKAVQDVISSLKYNHTKEQYFNVSKDRPLGRIHDTARQMLREGLPIKCVEAVFLALYLTAEMEDIDRIPVGFKSSMSGHVHRHIVLLVRERATGQFGALGISRRKELAYKELKYSSCSEILADFRRSYEKWWHEVLKIRIGLPVEGGEDSRTAAVCWRYLSLKVPGEDWANIAKAIDTYAECCKRLLSKWKLSGVKEDLSAVTKLELADTADNLSDHGDAWRRPLSTSRGALVASRQSGVFDPPPSWAGPERARSSAERQRLPRVSAGEGSASFRGVSTPRDRDGGAAATAATTTAARNAAAGSSRGRSRAPSRPAAEQAPAQQHRGERENGGGDATSRQSSQFASVERQRPALVPSSVGSARLNSRGGGASGPPPPAWGAGPGLTGATKFVIGSYPAIGAGDAAQRTAAAAATAAAAVAAAVGANAKGYTIPASTALQPAQRLLPVLTQAC